MGEENKLTETTKLIMSDQCCNLEARPLTNLEEILNWTPNEKEGGRSSVNLQSRTCNSVAGMKTLVCHDMKSGYLDDRFTQGVNHCDAYRFFHWSYIDFFVYFSHNFITIPTPSWIDAGHLHGVKVLGTLITEWDDGDECCNKFLEDEKIIRRFVDKLVDLTKFYNFDGWLINIENKIKRTNISNLELFVQSLTLELHEKQAESKIFWYDSVIKTGELEWQNELNEKNKCFFDCCDGIYLNYNWKEDHLDRSVKEAMPRVLDVFAGIDIFGRGTMGGGGFNSSEPLKVAKDRGLSIALFAPGWVHEFLGESSFTENEYKFWSLLTDLLPIHGPTRLPFSTSFCQGFGEKTFLNGQIINNAPWCNLSLQQHQPSCNNFQNGASRIYLKDGFEGGGCLKLHIPTNGLKYPLLHCSFPLNEPLKLICVWKSMNSDDVNLIFSIILKNSTGSRIEQQLKIEFKTSEENQNGGHGDWNKNDYVISAQGSRQIELIQVEIDGPTRDVLIGKLELIPLTYLHSTITQMDINLEDLVLSSDNHISCILKWPQNNVTSLPRYVIFLLTENGRETCEKFIATTRRHFYQVWRLSLRDCPLGRRRFVIQTRGAGIDPIPLRQCPSVDVT